VSRVSERAKPKSKVRKNREPFFVPTQIELFDEGTQEVSHDSFNISTDDLLQEIWHQKEDKGGKKGNCDVNIEDQRVQNGNRGGMIDDSYVEIDDHEVILEDSRICKSDKPSTSNVSVLDEIFSSSVIERTKRKPAPKRNKPSKTKCDGSDDLFSDSLSAEEEVGELSKVRTDSTLKDEDFDCFTDPSRRKTRRSKAQIIVSRLIAESEATYRRLPVVPIGSELDEVDSCDRSPSLF
jgi:hypothetical protein